MATRTQAAPGTPATDAPEPCSLRSQLEALRDQLDRMRLMGANIAACTVGSSGEPTADEDKPKPVPEPLTDIAEEALQHSLALDTSLRQIAHQILPGGTD